MRTVAKGSSGRAQKRSPTRYALVPREQLQPVATVEAHNRRAAARQVDDDVVAIPVRSLA